MVTYLLVFGIITVWVIVDALRRGTEPQVVIAWGVGTLVLGPVVAPYYFASRSLASGEVREGNFAWNILKYFAVFWTVFMLTVGIQAIFRAGKSVPAPGTEVEIIGVTLVALTMIAVWLVPFVGSLALGRSLRNTSALERGPTDASGTQQRSTRVN